MKIGIVGAEKAKFTPKGKHRAKKLIRKLLMPEDITKVVSGGCHLGGIDKWAEDIADELKIPVKVYLPQLRSWAAGYKPRNLRIAKHSDRVVCITVDKLPKHFIGMRFKLCYHCKTDKHVKSGGCWTVKQAKMLGKETRVYVVKNY
jgi:hypothetical protein